MKETLITLFKEFREERLEKKYHFGDDHFRKSVPADADLQNNGCNQFMETEDDYKVKLGGFLEERLLALNMTVHSELNRIYKGNDRPDLSIHAIGVGSNEFWTNDRVRQNSLRAVIELKGANLKDADYDFKTGKIEADIKKLRELADPSALVRCLIILDEGCRVDNDWAKLLKKWIEESDSDVFVLSNNKELCVG